MRSKNPESKLKVLSYTVSLAFSVLILLPFVYMVGNGLKDLGIIYETKPELWPASARSVSVVADYSGVKGDEAALLEMLERDSTKALYTIPYELNKDRVYEVRFYGTKDGKVIYYTSAHQSQLRLELDFGIYAGAVISENVLMSGDRHKQSAEKLGYEFDLSGIDRSAGGAQLKQSKLDDAIASFLTSKYKLQGQYAGTAVANSPWLMVKSFGYYLELPVYMYKSNKTIQQFGFMTFGLNTLIVIGFAIVSETVLCSVTAYALSKLMKKRTADKWLLFFLVTMMVPFVTIMVPQFMMFKNMGFYDNYAALLLPFLYPYPYFILLYKGFFDQLPNSLFDASRVDGASELYNYAKICMPLSKPIISLIALNTFLGNWNDFFWAYMVTEKQSLWTLNLALFNLSQNSAVKPNFLMGLSLVTIIPVILLTVVFSSRIKQSVAYSGIKG